MVAVLCCTVNISNVNLPQLMLVVAGVVKLLWNYYCLTKVLLFNVYIRRDIEYDHENAELCLDLINRLNHVRNRYPDICNYIIGGYFYTD